MTSERVTSGMKLAFLSAALFLLVAACGEQGSDQGAAPPAQEPTQQQ
jgi:uncharacterized lipoprotein YajG